MKTSKVLEKALEWLGPKGEKWIQNSYYDRDDGTEPCKACAIGAIRLVTKTPYAPAENWFHCFIDDTFKIYNSAISWNDANGRRFATIRSVFKKAIAKAKKEEEKAA